MEYICGGGKGRPPETCRCNNETCHIHETMKLVHKNMIYV